MILGARAASGDSVHAREAWTTAAQILARNRKLDDSRDSSTKMRARIHVDSNAALEVPIPAEVQVTIAQRSLVEALLRAGLNVICDDTNLRTRYVKELAALATACGADVVVRDFTDVPVEECVTRDAAREPPERVGEEAIRAMWRRYLSP